MNTQYFYRCHTLHLIDGKTTVQFRLNDGERIVSERRMYDGDIPCVVVTVRVAVPS